MDIVFYALYQRNLNPEKAHGWNDISVTMIQLCGNPIAESLRISFIYLFIYLFLNGVRISRRLKQK